METLGHKAAGLARLPASWTPRYVCISAEAAADLASVAGTDVVTLAARLRTSPSAAGLQRLFDASPSGVIVRSSALDEDISARGLYLSVETTFASFQTFGEALARIWDHAARVDRGPARIPVVVQTRLDPVLFGHLSNETRLRRDRRDWVVEVGRQYGRTVTSGLRALRVDRVSPDQVDLTCNSPSELRTALRRVAGSFTRIGERLHFEWLWDGTRVWIVQCDAVPELRSARPRATGRAAAIPDLSVFRMPTEEDRDIPKVRCIAEYVAAGLPHAGVAVLRDARIITELAQGRCPNDLLSDLEHLAGAEVVVRSDYSRIDGDFEVLLPRTETEHSATKLGKFLVSTVKSMLDKGVAAKDIVFLTHPFIPADAAAWSLSAPLSSDVRVDATHGLPDGLLFYSHDSYVANPRRGDVHRHIRAKESILVADSDGSWRRTALGAPWSWRSSLDDEEVLEIARISKRLADHLGRPVETMFFVRARTADGTVVPALPWVHRTESVAATRIAATESHFTSGTAVEVRTRADADLLTEALSSMEPGQRLLVRLTPDGELLQDRIFLERIIGMLRPENAVVELAGSDLSHVYYELQRAGVQVRAEDPVEPREAEAMPFDKLVRDLIPQEIAAKGERVRAYAADGNHLRYLLKRKLVEEAFEVGGAETTNEMMEELGDVLDVLEALCTLSGTELDAVRAWTARKREERGGFQRGLVLLETRERSLNEAITASGPDFSLSPALGAEVARRGDERRSSGYHVLERALEIPYGLPTDRKREAVRLIIDGVEFRLLFGTSGLRLERSGPAGRNPDQLALRI
jgi:predicted house-cleaning noncanonical NTP pyrophosphatase (MazG superfamily)